MEAKRKISEHWFKFLFDRVVKDGLPLEEFENRSDGDIIILEDRQGYLYLVNKGRIEETPSGAFNAAKSDNTLILMNPATYKRFWADSKNIRKIFTRFPANQFVEEVEELYKEICLENEEAKQFEIKETEKEAKEDIKFLLGLKPRLEKELQRQKNETLDEHAARVAEVSKSDIYRLIKRAERFDKAYTEILLKMRYETDEKIIKIYDQVIGKILYEFYHGN